MLLSLKRKRGGGYEKDMKRSREQIINSVIVPGLLGIQLLRRRFA